MSNVFGVYRPDGLPEMPITSTWSEEDLSYHIEVVGTDIEFIVDSEDAESAKDAFGLVEEEIARELTCYAFTR